MEKQNAREKTKGPNDSGKGAIEGLAIEHSPYLNYKDLEDYKNQGYGAQGHEQPKEGRGAGATEAPTLSGADVSLQGQFNVADAAHRKSVP
ncbi:uncharacterized protein LOC131607921 [Vicia villosa]|uniref:uncharacterized protein LOC131607921 n=1 Tax=Vicia villosa TaxID=3911 RepID=UPI00273A9449|nr:uncharacterized protein LOC131607921 [Vicia villosa]